MLRIKAFRDAFKGMIFFLRFERHAIIHLIAAFLVCLAGIWFELEIWEWVSLFFAIALVLVSEIINSSIERLTDLISPHYSKKAGAVKDLGAAAVLTASGFAAMVGLFIFAPRIIALLPLP